MKRFLLLLSFMTRIPIKEVEYNREELGKSMIFFPLVGVIIGIFLIFTYRIFLMLTSNFLITSIFIVLVEILLTGALHLDGLADTFDGIYSYRDKDKILEIMKDSRIGTNGVIALLVTLCLKISCIYFLISYGLNYILVIYPIIGRLASLSSCVFSPYAKKDGMGKCFVDYTNKKSLLIAFLYSLIFFFSVIRESVFEIAIFISLALPLVILIFSFFFSKKMERTIGGITGDTLGALLELSETLYLILVVIVLNIGINSLVWW